MAGTRTDPPTTGYREWRQHPVELSGRSYLLATKPGALAHGDPATLLLAERAAVAEGETVVQMSCGSGLFGAVAAAKGGAGRVLLTDRNVVACEAARRTLAANGAESAKVFLGHGAYALPAGVLADVVAIRIPHEKMALLQLLWDAFHTLRVGGRCYIAGANNEGIKPAARTLERLFGNAESLGNQSGHRIVVAEKRGEEPASTDELASPYLRPDVFHELHATLRGRELTLFSRPGVFSWDHVDEATEILADVMRVEPGQSVLDLGCGYGALGVVAGTLSHGGPVCMVDADAEAVRSAHRSAATAGLDRYRALTSDVGAAVLDERFDVVVTNPPFHVGKATDLDLPLQFIEDARTVLAPGGRLFLVANRTLPYEHAIQRRFGNLGTLHDGRRFKVLTAERIADSG